MIKRRIIHLHLEELLEPSQGLKDIKKAFMKLMIAE
jgi:hypothetical protein